MAINPELAPVFVRVHTRLKDEEPRPEREWKQPNKWANFALVFDCETTTDLNQNLTFLWWRFCELKNNVYVSQQEGVVYADDLNQGAVELIREYAAGEKADVEPDCPEKIQVQSRTEFVNREFWKAVRLGAVIVCFNAPFDLSRLGLEYREAQDKNTGWSIVLWKYKGNPDKLKPRLRIKPKDSRSAFINLAGGDPNMRLVYRGRFLDVSVLGWALRNKHFDLDGFLRSFGLKGKMEHEPTGQVTKKELQYGRTDVERTVELLNAMKAEYDGFPLELPPESAMSAASITKAFLDKMRIKQPVQKFNVPDEIYGKCMQAYYGGRSEIRIRHQEVPVVVCDTTSEYPSVAALLNLWSALIAADVKVEKCTAQARDLLDRTTLATLLQPSTWRDLAFFACIEPADDILPVRSLYGETEDGVAAEVARMGNTNIGVNPLTSSEPIWYAGPDLAASKLETKRCPKVLDAFRLVPYGLQEGTKTTVIGKRQFDPAKEDFFRVVIEERKNLPKSHPHYLLLKIIANSLYGIFAELNKYECGEKRPKQIEVFSGEHKHEETTLAVERPGRWQFPPAAALITSGGRLMLAILEHMVEEKKGTYLLTDTDSMLFVASKERELVPCEGGPYKTTDGTPVVQSITWEEVKEIAATLNSLNPYDPKIVGEILKIEDSNYDRSGTLHQLYGLAVSAKRYVVYTHRRGSFQIIKPSEHGLGIVYVPDKRKRYKPEDCKDQETSYPRWVVESWEQLLEKHFRETKDPENASISRELWFGKLPAVMRVRVTTSNVLKALRKRDPGAAKPYNFALSPILVQPLPECTLVAPFSKHPKEWLERDYTEIHTGDVVNLAAEYRGKKLLPQTLSSVVWRHYLHPEGKSLSPDGNRCGPYTRGLLLRRPIQALTPFGYIGKEIERSAQEGEDISLIETDGPVRYGPRLKGKTHAADARLILRAKDLPFRRLMREADLSQHALERFLSGARVYPSTRAKLARAIEKLEREVRERG